MIAMPREVKDVIEKLKNDPDFKKEVENLAKKYAEKYRIGNVSIVVTIVAAIAAVLVGLLIMTHLGQAVVNAGGDQNNVNTFTGYAVTAFTMVGIAVIVLGAWYIINILGK
jgi:hypothetical protein